MTVKKVLRMGHPVLREKAQHLSNDEILSDETRELIKDMYDTMKAEGGIGIAAPQIGVSKSITLINIESGQSRYDSDQSTPLLIIINPKITILDQELQGFWEGCLSVPGLRGFVKRPRKVQIDYMDEHAAKKSIIAEDFLATVFQHELDHLFGLLYIDKIHDTTMLSYNEEFTQFWVEDPDEVPERE